MTPSTEDLKKSLTASELKTLAEKGCGNCYAQDCNWPNCYPKAAALSAKLVTKPDSRPEHKPDWSAA